MWWNGSPSASPSPHLGIYTSPYSQPRPKHSQLCEDSSSTFVPWKVGSYEISCRLPDKFEYLQEYEASEQLHTPIGTRIQLKLLSHHPKILSQHHLTVSQSYSMIFYVSKIKRSTSIKKRVTNRCREKNVDGKKRSGGTQYEGEKE